MIYTIDHLINRATLLSHTVGLWSQWSQFYNKSVMNYTVCRQRGTSIPTAALVLHPDADTLISLTLRCRRPVQSCVCGLRATAHCSQTQWGRRSAPGRRKPSHHSSWMRSSEFQCSVEKGKKKSEWWLGYSSDEFQGQGSLCRCGPLCWKGWKS